MDSASLADDTWSVRHFSVTTNALYLKRTYHVVAPEIHTRIAHGDAPK